MNARRAYTMTSRARAADETRTRILDACVALHGERLSRDVGLEDIAGRASVTVQTVLRHYRSRTGLMEAVAERVRRDVVEERRAPVGDVHAAVRAVVQHYEERGDQVLLMLAQEEHEELMREAVVQGRRMHRAWVEEVFAPYLETAANPDELTDLLAVASDVYVWKLLRRDRGLSRDQTVLSMLHLVSSLLSGRPSTGAWSSAPLDDMTQETFGR
jgi:AcrR family transcriptional regulator